MVGLEAQVNKIIINCDNCGKELKLTQNQFEQNKHHFCNNKCFADYQKRNQIKCICPVCGKNFTRKTLYKGEGNHQYGLTGSKNSSWKSDERYKNHTRKYTLIRVEDHPFCDKANFVPEHRLVAEKYLLTDDNSIEVDGKKYLKPECVVHHIDFNKKNNDVENLYVFESDSMHALFHNLFNSNRVESIEDFERYYKTNYINKILNYDWLYKAYITFDLSINQISKLFNIPYTSVQTEVYKHNLDEIKKHNKHKEELLKLIVKELQEMSNALGSSSK